MSKTFNQKIDELIPQELGFGETFDIPTIVLVVASLGVLFMGMLQSTFFFIFRSFWAHSWLWNELLKGLIVIGLSLICSVTAAVYWWLVPRRLGTIEPRLIGFAFFLSLLALCSGMTISAFAILE